MSSNRKLGLIKIIYFSLYRPVFRSYNPADEGLQNAAMPKASAIDIESHVADSLEQSAVTKLVDDVVCTFFKF